MTFPSHILETADNTITGISGNMHDTKEADRKPSRQQEQYEFLVKTLDNSKEIILTIDLEKKVIANVNEAISILGYKPEDWISTSFDSWKEYQRQKLHELVHLALQSELPVQYHQITFSNKSGTEDIPFEFSASVFYFENTRYLLCVLRDIRERLKAASHDGTEREKLLIELEQSLAKERELNELRIKFVSTASHQFRTPLTVIQSGVEIMDLYLDDLPAEKQAKFRNQFKKIQEEVGRLEYLMNDVLLLGRANVARTPFHPEKRSLVQFCKSIIEDKYNNRFEPLRHVLLTVEGKESEVTFDPELIGHAIENIIDNAYKYSEHGNIFLNLIYQHDRVTIQITDQGIGIPKEDIKNLFQPFYRAKNTFEIEGTGLGLSIVKEFVEKHNGKIFLTSELNKGTTVSVILPGC